MLSNAQSTYSGLLQYMDDCTTNFQTVCYNTNVLSTYINIRDYHPVKVLNCLYSNSSLTTSTCFLDIYNHVFKTCAQDAVNLCTLSDPGENGEGDEYWVTDFYPFRKSIECLTTHITLLSNSNCQSMIQGSGYYTCQSDIAKYCTSNQITTAAQLMTCLSHMRSSVSTACLAQMNSGIPQNWDNLNIAQMQYYGEIFYGMPVSTTTGTDNTLVASSRTLTPLGVFFVLLFLVSAVAGGIYARKK